MKKKTMAILLGVAVMMAISGCSGKTAPEVTTAAEMAETVGETEAAGTAANETETDIVEAAEVVDHEIPEDGIYLAEFKSDSSMFHVNEACDGRGTLTVENGEMTLHISLASKKIVNLYYGLAEDAKNDEEHWLMPTTDTVTYEDGMEEEVYGFDIPVPGIGEEFDVALIGTHGNWYDHKVTVKDPVAAE